MKTFSFEGCVVYTEEKSVFNTDIKKGEMFLYQRYDGKYFIEECDSVFYWEFMTTDNSKIKKNAGVIYTSKKDDGRFEAESCYKILSVE